MRIAPVEQALEKEPNAHDEQSDEKSGAQLAEQVSGQGWTWSL